MKAFRHTIINLSIILVIVVFVFTISIVLNKKVNKDSNHMANLIVNITDSLKNNDAKLAKEYFDILDSEWHNTQSKWTIFIHHSKILIIDGIMRKLGEEIEVEDIKNSIIECGYLQHLLDTTKDLEKLSFENIF